MIYYSFLLLLLCVPHTIYTFTQEFKGENKGEKGQELLLCRKCGSDVADSYYLFTKTSSGAHKTEKQNLFGRKNITVQTLVNPFGINFDIVTAEKARCENLGQPQGADSWFPGYAWRICACPRCGQHLGWTFESVMAKDTKKEKDHIEQFHGLILSNVLGENYPYVLHPYFLCLAILGSVAFLCINRLRYGLPNNDAKDIQYVTGWYFG